MKHGMKVFLSGIAAGSVIGMLAAPHKGKRTRRKIIRSLNKAKRLFGRASKCTTGPVKEN